jgi:hypothetical protein
LRTELDGGATVPPDGLTARADTAEPVWALPALSRHSYGALSAAWPSGTPPVSGTVTCPIRPDRVLLS